jgi:cysteine desulfurase
MHQIYLDYAAATPLDGRVLAAMQPYFSDTFYNPSATYLAAVHVRRDVEMARALVASELGARAPEVVFTAGGTEANNLAIHGIMRLFPGRGILTSTIEHESVRAAAGIYVHREAPVREDGILDGAHFSKCIDDDTVLVSIMYANNEVGTVQPLRDVAASIRRIRAERRAQGNTLPLYFHTDAAQAGNYLDLHVSRLGVDLMTLNGGKIYGPKQSGALWVRSGIELEPLMYGGGQERGLRNGTENVPGIIGFSTALQLAQSLRHEESMRVRQLQRLFFDTLALRIPSVVRNGSNKKRLPNNVHITVPGLDNERLLMGLDEAGIMAAAGSACSASSEDPSHVLRAMGVSRPAAQSSLRFTLGRTTSEDAIHRTVEVLARLVQD